jgi:exoribonuclease-2
VLLDRLPLIVRVPSLPQVLPGTYVELEISEIDLLERSLNAKFLHRQEA